MICRLGRVRITSVVAESKDVLFRRDLPSLGDDSCDMRNGDSLETVEDFISFDLLERGGKVTTLFTISGSLIGSTSEYAYGNYTISSSFDLLLEPGN